MLKIRLISDKFKKYHNFIGRKAILIETKLCSNSKLIAS